MGMAGIYIHIPFCERRCAYCDFFSTTRLERRGAYIDALLEELAMRADYLRKEEVIETIYFGGGTPSQLDASAVGRLLDAIGRQYNVKNDAEITLEANPSDLTTDYAGRLLGAGVNRLSIGIQSFQDVLLQTLGRRHDAATAKNSVRMAQESGFRNISIDLMYGLPRQTLTQWQTDLEEAIALGVQHISTYCLSYEKNTLFGKMLAEGKLEEASEELANTMYESTIARLKEAGFHQYEVSNFSLPNYYSRHNSSYWNNVAYIGIGAGAHSYDGKSRQWNVSDIERYMDSIRASVLPCEREILSKNDLYNERVMLSLRTDKGLALSELSDEERRYCMQHARGDIERGLLVKRDDHLVASLRGIEVLNRIIENLIIV